MGPSVDTKDPPVFHLKVSWFSIAWLWNYSQPKFKSGHSYTLFLLRSK